MGHIQGLSRTQLTMFPEALDDLIEPNSAVRVIDAFISTLDLAALGFVRAMAASTGRPGYAPSDLLKLYVYGYLHQIRSSRRLECEARRNMEVLWLINRLSPDFKTIADFRKDNTAGLIGVCRAFTGFCREQQLFGAQLVAIDGSKFQAVASRKQVWTAERLQKSQAQLDERIAAYLAGLDAQDEQEQAYREGDPQAALAALVADRAKLQALAQQLQSRGETQHVASEPEAKLMRTAQGAHTVAYNVQSAVDAKHALIVAFEVTADQNDRQQLAPMAKQAQSALHSTALTVLADTGYDHGEQAAQCEAHHITAVVPAHPSPYPFGSYFDKQQFSYDAQEDRYRCPAGQWLYRFKSDRSRKRHYYSTEQCAQCCLRARCTPTAQRSVMRSFFASAAERMHARASSEQMRLRGAVVEHPFAGLKHLMGNARFLVRGIAKASAEMALLVLSYNLKRVMNIRGARSLIHTWA